MSKQLKSIQELWSYLLYCPICKKDCRKIDIYVHPSDNLRISSFTKENNFLNINVIHDAPMKTTFNLIIDCNNNFCKIQNAASYNNGIIDLYLEGNCIVCNKTYAGSSEIELFINKEDKLIQNIEIAKEQIKISYAGEAYRITLLHNRGLGANKLTAIHKCSISDYNTFIDIDKPIFLPFIIGLDPSKPDKAINRIKNLITFS